MISFHLMYKSLFVNMLISPFLLFYSILSYSILYYSVSFYFTLHHSILFFSILFNNIFTYCYLSILLNYQIVRTTTKDDKDEEVVKDVEKEEEAGQEGIENRNGKMRQGRREW